jgi:minimal PKS acyl carrier protein
MGEFTLAEFKRILCATGGESDAMHGDILNRTFDELGYDSLALLNFAGRVAEEYGVEIPDDVVRDFSTPRTAIVYIDGRLKAESEDVPDGDAAVEDRPALPSAAPARR